MVSPPFETLSARFENDAAASGLPIHEYLDGGPPVTDPDTDALPPAQTVWAQAAAAALRFGPALLLVLLAAAVLASGLLKQIDMDHLDGRRLSLEAYVGAHPVQAAAVYLAIFSAGITLSLPIALLLTLLGGLLFGWVQGGLLAAAASTLGGLATFLICRTAVGDLIMRLAGPRMMRFQEGAQKDAFSLILTLRLVPMTPFWLINVGAACVRIPLRPYILATAIGVIPSSLIYASLGAGLETLLESGGPPRDLILRPQVLVPLIGLAVLGVLPLAVRWIQRRRAVIAQTPRLK